MISEIMSKNIIYGSLDNSIKDISKLMKDNNIGFIPIKKNNECVGVITDRDICLSLVDINDLNTNIKSYMTNNIIYIDSNETIDEALKLMSKNKVKRLLVKEKDNTVGVLSLSDILNYTNNDNIIKAYRTIFYIHDNGLVEIADIDDFYL